MRIPCVMTRVMIGSVLACGLSFAGQNEAVVYTAGNVTGVIPRANAVLDLSQDIAMKLRIGRTDVSVPFASITNTEEAADSTVVPSPGQRKEKPFELLTIQFNSVQGDQRTMTLQMSRLSATHVLAAIKKHTPESTVAAVATSAPPQAAPAPDAAPVSTPASAKSGKSSDKKAQAEQAKADKKAKADQAKADKQAKADQAAKDKAAEKVAKAEKKDKKNKKDSQSEVSEAKSTPPAGAKTAAKKDAWWGDSYWRTTRNQSTWEQQGSTAAAQ